MKSRSFVLQACAVGVVTAALFLTACGGLGGGSGAPGKTELNVQHQI